MDTMRRVLILQVGLRCAKPSFLFFLDGHGDPTCLYELFTFPVITASSDYRSKASPENPSFSRISRSLRKASI